MRAVSIGIQVIMPKTATSAHTAPQQQANERDADAAAVTVRQAPPPPGMGKLVDKTV